MADNIFENLTDEERNNLWMYMIFNQDKIKKKTDQWTKEAEKRGMTLTEYLESINPLDKNKEELPKLPTWLGKNCKDCGNEKCKKLGTLPKGYDCALWQPQAENYSIKMVTNAEEAEAYPIREVDKYRKEQEC
jgi:hypothetical protein